MFDTVISSTEEHVPDTTRDVLTVIAITVTERPLTVDFGDIMAVCRVEPDDDPTLGPPWDDCDGYSHNLVPVRYSGERKARGWVRDGSPICTSRRVVLDPSIRESVFDYFRGLGASRQVAREKAAVQVRQIVDQIVQWHEGGWTWYVACCDYGGQSASLGGLDEDDSPYIHNNVFPDLAREVAHRLRDAGHVIVNEPDWRSVYVSERRAAAAARLRNNVNLFNRVYGPWG